MPLARLDKSSICLDSFTFLGVDRVRKCFEEIFPPPRSITSQPLHHTSIILGRGRCLASDPSKLFYQETYNQKKPIKIDAMESKSVRVACEINKQHNEKTKRNQKVDSRQDRDSKSVAICPQSLESSIDCEHGRSVF